MKNRPIKNDVDVVFCIDATASMAPCLEMVKENEVHCK